MDYAGNRTPLAPEYTYNLALQYSLPLLESFDFFHKEDSLVDHPRRTTGRRQVLLERRQHLKQGSYELVNLRTGLETDNYSITFWAKNVFDKKVQLRGLRLLRLVGARAGGGPRAPSA